MYLSFRRRSLSFLTDLFLYIFFIFISKSIDYYGYPILGLAVGVFLIFLNFYFFKKSPGKMILKIKMKDFSETKLLVRNFPGVLVGIIFCYPDDFYGSLGFIDSLFKILLVLSILDKIPVFFSKKGSVIDHILKIQFCADK